MRLGFHRIPEKYQHVDFALCDPGATQQIIERAKLGRAVPAESVECCEQMLREWLAQPVPEKVESDDDYLAQFDRRAIAGRFAGLLDQLLVSHTKVRANTERT